MNLKILPNFAVCCLVLLVVLAACGSDGKPATTAPTAPEEPEPPTPSTPEPPPDTSFSDLEQRIVAGINAQRMLGGMCGGDAFDPTTPVAWNNDLAEAARVHMEDNLANDLSADPHTGSNGSSVADRVTAASPATAWLVVGENLAYNRGSPRNEIPEIWAKGWHESPVHCRNQLNPVFNRVGVSVGVRNALFVGVVVFGQKAGS